MKRFIHFIGIIGTITMVICDIAEFLAIPALFIVIGLLNSYSWLYYAITIGGYIVLFIVAEIIAHFVFKALDKKYTPLIERKLEKYFNKFSNKC
jgi:bacteriorhodopsin